MNLKPYLDSTYLKTALQAKISDIDNETIVIETVKEAIAEQFKLVMIRPEYVAMAKKLIADANSSVDVGTVISFPEGVNSVAEKCSEAQLAIDNGADDLDFVINYTAFKNGDFALVKQEILECTKLGTDNNKVVKWIIETAALSTDEIIRICVFIKNSILANFKEHLFASVFIKSSTGFYVTQNNQPNGATIDAIVLMLENGSPLSIKASGGIKSYDDAVALLRMGVKRIGTSAAKQIANGIETDGY